MFDRSGSRIVVPDRGAAERIAIELVRNALIAHPDATFLATGIDSWPALRAFLETDAARFGARTGERGGRVHLRLVGAGEIAEPDAAAGMVVVLPGARSEATAAPAATRIELEVGAAAGELVVVPGTARMKDGAHTLTAETYGRLRRAERIVRRRPVRALVLSGWNGPGEAGPSEAAQMFRAWRGPTVPIILDEAARTTAENALWSASLAGALGDVHRVRMVTSWVSSVRLGLATRAALRDTGVRLRLSIVWGRGQAASWRPAIGGLLHLRRHLRIGRALLADGPGSPDAQL